MVDQSTNRFRLRAFTSLTLAAAFSVVAISGLVLYIAPACGVARRLGWTVCGLAKDTWSDLHVTVALLFVVVCLVHALSNLRPLVYLRRRVGSGWVLRRELGTAVLVIAVVLLGTVLSVPPFSAVAGLSERCKSAWAARSSQ